MARFTDRVAYRFAGLVWTAIYSGLASRSSRGTARTPIEREVSAMREEPAPGMAAA